MASLDVFYEQLWHALNPAVPLNPDSGLYQAWTFNYTVWGSPIAGEGQLDDGTPIQVFAAAIVQWTNDGAIVV